MSRTMQKSDEEKRKLAKIRLRLKLLSRRKKKVTDRSEIHLLTDYDS
jgi:hypothetical protein